MVIRFHPLAIFVAGLSLAATASCAAVWGYEPLTLAPDDADASGDDASIDQDGTTDDANGNPIDGASSSDASKPPSDGGSDGGSDTASDTGAPSTLTCLSSNGSCTCNANGSGNSGACSPSAVGIDPGSMICCADPSYPSNGACTCNWIGCTTSSNTCICGPQNGAPGGSCAASTWTCCLQTGASECLCSAAACMPGFTDFGNACAIKDVKCAAPSHRVDACR